MSESIMFFVYIFALAIFIGFEIITKVPPLLHTPLMSGSNAISGITVVGALLIAGIASQGENALLSKILGMIALVFATINVVGGFLVTDRMLEMFKKEKAKGEEKK
jgi:NAD(P) transhydrogenase subunit alpha